MIKHVKKRSGDIRLVKIYGALCFKRVQNLRLCHINTFLPRHSTSERYTGYVSNVDKSSGFFSPRERIFDIVQQQSKALLYMGL